MPARVWHVRHTFVDHLRRAGPEWPIDFVGVGGDPREVCGAPVHIVLALFRVRVGENLVVGGHCSGEVAACRVHEAFRFPCGSGGVHDEQRVFRIERFRCVLPGLAWHDFVPPDVAAFGPRDVAVAGAVDHEHVLKLIVAGRGFVRDVFDGHGFAAAVLAVARDEQFGTGVFDAETQCFRAESAENERMHGPDACARERDDDGLHEHRKVDHDAVAAADAEFRERVGGLGDFLGEFAVGHGAAVARLAFEVERDLVPIACRYVAVCAVDGGVEGASREPGLLEPFLSFRVGRGQRVHGVPRGLPRELGGLFRPVRLMLCGAELCTCVLCGASLMRGC